MADMVKLQVPGVLRHSSGSFSDTSSLLVKGSTSPLQASSPRVSSTNSSLLAEGANPMGQRLRRNASFRTPLTDMLNPDPSSDRLNTVGEGDAGTADSGSASPRWSPDSVKRRTYSDDFTRSPYERTSDSVDGLPASSMPAGAHHGDSPHTAGYAGMPEHNTHLEPSEENSMYDSYESIEELMIAVNESMQNKRRPGGVFAAIPEEGSPRSSTGGRSSGGGAKVTIDMSTHGAASPKGRSGSSSTRSNRVSSPGAAQATHSSRADSPRSPKLAAMLGADYVTSPRMARLKQKLAGIERAKAVPPPDSGKFAAAAARLGGRMEQFQALEDLEAKKYKAALESAFEGIFKQVSPTGHTSKQVSATGHIPSTASPSHASQELPAGYDPSNPTSPSRSRNASGSQVLTSAELGARSGSSSSLSDAQPVPAMRPDDPVLMQAFVKLVQGQAMLHG